MALSFRWTISDVSGGNFVPVTTGSYSLRVSPFSASTYAGTHVANGSWNFGTVADGVYQLWNESGTPAQVLSFGEQQLVDSAISSIGITLPSNMNANSFKLTTLAAGTTNGDSVRYEQVVRTSGDQASLAGAKTWTGVHTFSESRPIMSFEAYIAPANNYHLTDKKYVDDQVAAITTHEYQESDNHVRVFPDGTEESGKVYTAVLAAVNSFDTPAATNQCLVEIVGMGTSGNYISGAVGSLKAYVNITGKKHIWFIPLDSTKTAAMQISDLTLVLSSNGGTITSRSYNSMVFDNLIVYHYMPVTLTNCEVRNCLFLGSGSNAVTINGTTKVISSQFNNTVVTGGSFTGIRVDMNETFTYAPPTDPIT